MAEGFLRDLVGIKSVNPPGNELEVAQYIQKALGKYGISGEIRTVDPNRANYVACVGRGEKKIILNGHLDVVPPGNGWDEDPFTPFVRGSKLYGRGSCDMKAGLAAMMAIAVRAKEEKLMRKGRLMLVFTADEEADGLGTKQFVKEFEDARENVAVIIGEPTENRICIAHRGVVRFRLKVTGRQCHSGQPQNGINAIVNLSRVIVAVEQIHTGLQKIRHRVLPPPTMCCTMVNGGVNNNIIPGTAECVVDCRTIPGLTADALRDRILRQVSEQGCLDPGAGITVLPFVEVAAGMADPESGVVKTAAAAYAEAFGRAPELVEFPACCDMSCFTENGLETIVFGPGSISQAHMANEFVDLDQIRDSLNFYAAYLKEAQTRSLTAQ